MRGRPKKIYQIQLDSEEKEAGSEVSQFVTIQSRFGHRLPDFGRLSFSKMEV